MQTDRVWAMAFVLSCSSINSYAQQDNRKTELDLYAAGTDVRNVSDRRLDAIHSLGKFADKASSDLLLKIAVDPQVASDSRVAAVTELDTRKDSYISAELSRLLQPHIYPALRSAVATSLSQRHCDTTCAKNVLHYLERMFHGEPNGDEMLEQNEVSEQLAKTDPVQSKLTTDQLLAARSQTADSLNQVLRSNPVSTRQALEQIYGIGSWHPSRFGLRTIAVLGLTEECSELSRPKLDGMLDPGTREELLRTRASLCAGGVPKQ